MNVGEKNHEIGMNAFNVQGCLKEALYETLSGILSPDKDTRTAAEERIQALEVTDEFGIHLTEFVVDPNGSLAIRQLASVLLKQYVESHWSSTAEKFRPPEISHPIKERIKELLPLGLKESISKVRASVAYAISAIAHWDWPENWPGLFGILVNCLSGDSEFAVHGAMRVLTEFTRDLTDTQLPNVGPVILQEMYRIFQSENQYSIRTRSRAVEIFSTIASLVAMTRIDSDEEDLNSFLSMFVEKFAQCSRVPKGPMSEFQKSFVEQYLQPIIPMFAEKFVQCLRVPNGSTSDNGLKTEIIKAINCLITQLPKYVANYLPQILPPIWDTMTQSAKAYQDGTVNDNDDMNEKEVDSDGEIINFNNLIIATFDIIHAVIDQKRFSSLFDNHLKETIYYLVIFMQITEEQIELWANNPSQFVENDDHGFAYNVRISAQELLTALVAHSEMTSVNALCEVVTRHMEETNRQRAAITAAGGTIDPNSWKIHESSIFALCSVNDEIMEMLQSGSLHFDLVGFLDSLVLATLNDSGAHPFLLGRCLCAGGRFASKLPPEMCSRFLVATVNGLLENQPDCIRISAVKAIYWFCKASTAENPAIEGILRNHLNAIFQGLFSLANQPTSEVLTLVMETLAILVTLDRAFTESIENKICPLTIATFLKYHSDPVILELCKDIFKALTENPQCIGPLQTRIVPTLISMMAVNPMKEKEDEDIQDVALQVLKVLVRYSPTPLSSALVDNAFPAACHCILNFEDNSTLQIGGETIRIYLSVAACQITDHRDNVGCTGLQYILQIVAKLLNPRSSELTAAYVGKLVTTLIRKVGSTLGGDLDLLLKAVLSKMQQVEVSSVMQSLLMIYAHLINMEFDAVLNFLSTVPGPTGESALAFVLAEWVSRQSSFFGGYERKVTTVALSKILEHGVTNDDSRLNEISVEDEQIFEANEDGPRTRSKTQTRPYQWTKIPVLVKILKLIIGELLIDMESVGASDDSENSEDEEDEEESDKKLLNIGVGAELLRINDDDEDPDLLQDSIYHLNLNQYLRDFLMNFSSHHCFPAFVQHLTPVERKVLTKLNINQTYG